MVAMGEVQPCHVHTGLQHLTQDLDRVAGGAEGADDLGGAFLRRLFEDLLDVHRGDSLHVYLTNLATQRPCLFLDVTTQSRRLEDLYDLMLDLFEDVGPLHLLGSLCGHCDGANLLLA